MSIRMDGLKAKLIRVVVKTSVGSGHPLITLANKLDWEFMANIVLPDLKKTAKGCWWFGRRLNLRIHLAVLVLQTLLKQTDRGIENAVRLTPLYRVFCGYGILLWWRCPDHTKIEEFRNRLSPAAHKALGDYIVQVAVSSGYADPSEVDLDSTVQEANISYPSDASLMRKLAQKCMKVWKFFKGHSKKYLPKSIDIDIKTIGKKAKEYFFLSKNAAIEKRRKVFRDYHKLVKQQLSGFIRLCQSLSGLQKSKLPWNIRHTVDQIGCYGRRYLLDVASFIRTHKIKPGKILSFHCFSLACIKKGKAGKEHEFGRVFQLGRLGGNFMMAITSTDVRMEDKRSLIPAVKEHAKIFGQNVLKSIGTDKGYYSRKNIRLLEKLGINSDGVQRPVTVKKRPLENVVLPLRDRRAGIEPLIGHVKGFGLRKSKMKSDRATLSSGYRSVMGFNLHQMQRYISLERINYG